jgi:small conductance mechanosensitive channel
MDFSSLDIKQLVLEYGLPILKAIAILLIGLWIIKMAMKLFRKGLDGRDLEPSLKTFFVSMVGTLLKILLAISVLGTLGIEMTSFIAILGAAGLAVGMALSGTLQNFAGGVMLLLFKPFKVDDLISAQGHIGKVKEIQIFVTTLLSPESRTIILPNGPLANGDITNFTTEGKLRVDMTFGISYGADIQKAKDVLMEVIKSHPAVMEDPAPFIGVKELADSSVNLAVRPFTDPANYWDVYFKVYEQGKIALDKAGIEIPFPQLDIHKKN